MNREDVLWTLAGISFLHGYLAGNVLSALFGLGIGGYVIYCQRRFNPKVEVSMVSEKKLEEGKRGRVVLKVKNLGSEVEIKVIQNTPREIRVESLNGTVLKPGEEKFIEYSIIPEKKGEYEISTRVKVYDPNELYFEEFDVGRHKSKFYLPWTPSGKLSRRITVSGLEKCIKRTFFLVWKVWSSMD